VHGQEQWYELELSLPRPRIPCYIVDAFANTAAAASAAVAGSGNPAGVVPLLQRERQETDDAWMQTVAQEFNLSETAFVWRKAIADGVPDEDTNSNIDATSSIDPSDNHISERATTPNDEIFGIRYFTPSTEVPLCGHATLASAAVLYQTKVVRGDCAVVFEAKEDRLVCWMRGMPNSRCTQIAMEFPTKPVTAIVESTEECQKIHTVLQSAFPTLNVKTDVLFTGISLGLGDLLIELTPESFRSIGYDGLNIPALLDCTAARGVILCCSDDDDDDKNANTFCSRFFGPKAGIDEDPVTGSAHCALAPYFAARFQQSAVTGRQMSRRGGTVECHVSDDGATVQLTGTAVATVSGNLWM
jgi:PhzF family phenazine biosynthesis protein